MDIPKITSYNALGWCTDMWRGFSLHTFFVALLAAQFLIPPTWVKHGWDCLQRCRLAATTGAHCPLMEGAHSAKPQHHCHEQEATQSSPEWRCHCSQASPSLSTLDTPRFVLPQGVTLADATSLSSSPREPALRSGDQSLTPPDPPPRPLPLLVL
jgi:hypothetical protein